MEAGKKTQHRIVSNNTNRYTFPFASDISVYFFQLAQ